jgi:carbon storage regulator
MLVLTRKVNESLIVGDDIEIKVVEISGKAIKIGIDAPKDVSIYRKEIYEAIKEENLQASNRDNIISLVDFIKNK